jgi:hypothetical protein
MTPRDQEIMQARTKVYYCNLRTQVHHGCEHGESQTSNERRNENRRARHQAMLDLGLKRVKGALGGVYYE